MDNFVYNASSLYSSLFFDHGKVGLQFGSMSKEVKKVIRAQKKELNKGVYYEKVGFGLY